MGKGHGVGRGDGVGKGDGVGREYGVGTGDERGGEEKGGRGGTHAPVGAFAAAGPDLKAARPDFEAAGPGLEAARPDFEAVGPDFVGNHGHIRMGYTVDTAD